jgi:hypothetical protein
MAQLFRSMREASDGLPELGDNPRSLEIRPGIDVPAQTLLDIVQPGQGGLSVSPDDPLNLPFFRRPPLFQGIGKDPVWVLDEIELGADLTYRPDPSMASHGFLEPARPMPLGDFRRAIQQTRPLWTLVPLQGAKTNAS